MAARRSTLPVCLLAALLVAAATNAPAKQTPAASAKKPTDEQISEAQKILRNAELLVAAEGGDAAKVRTLLAQGVDPNAARTSGATALQYAVQGHHLDVVTALLAGNADPNRTSIGLTPLFMAAENGDLDIVQALIKAGANVNGGLKAVDEELKVRNGDTPLIAAASPSGKPEVVKALLAAGADLNAQADNGKTAVMQAVAAENVAVLKVLLDAKPDLTLRMTAPDDVDALTLAVGKSRADIAQMLIAAHADVEAKLDGEVTLLEFAILSDQPKIAEMLRKGGAREPSKARLDALRKAAAEAQE
jgi:ankyrin repeat protein